MSRDESASPDPSPASSETPSATATDPAVDPASRAEGGKRPGGKRRSRGRGRGGQRSGDSKKPAGKGAGARGQRGNRRERSMGKRRLAREMAVQMLYQHELGGSTLDEIFRSFDILDALREIEAAAAAANEAAKPTGTPGESDAPPSDSAGLVRAAGGAGRSSDPVVASGRPNLQTVVPGDLAPWVEPPDAPTDPSRAATRRKQADEAFEYAQRLVNGTLEHGEAVDELIRAHAENWRLERMPTIDRNILRLALYEMLHESSVPKVVIVDEAIELAKKFGAENSGRFVNGLLDGVLKSKQFSDRGSSRSQRGRGPGAHPAKSATSEPTAEPADESLAESTAREPRPVGAEKTP